MDSLTKKLYIPKETVIFARRNIHSAPEEKAEIPQVQEEVKANTNVMSINFADIEKANAIATGDPVRCERCFAYYNAHSKYDKITKTWLCEFCEYPNVLSLDEEAIPKTDIITYIDPNQEEIKVSEEVPTSSATTVIFCIDLSSSMSASSHCAESLKYQENPGSVTRLECVKVAIDSQIQKLAKEAPNTKVGLVTFTDEVIIIGDNTMPNYKVKSSLDNFDQLVEEAKKIIGKYVTRPISETLPEIVIKLGEMKADGCTALGPALLLSVKIATEQGQPGSKVILCTDGMANSGIGQGNSSSDYESSLLIYSRIGDIAMSKGVVISLVSIAESDCRLDMLAPCSLKTGGNIVKIDPMNLSSDFDTFLKEKVIAFDCTIAIKLHRGMKFVTADLAALTSDHSVFVKKLGNVLPTLVFTFEYLLRSLDELIKDKIDISKLKSLPFQALLSYIGPDSVRYCKVISRTQEITTAYAEVIKDVNVDVLSIHSMKKAGDYALQGNIAAAKTVTLSYRNLVKGEATENRYNDNVRGIEAAINTEETMMEFRGGKRSDNLISNISKTVKFKK